MTDILSTVYAAAKAMHISAALLVAVCSQETGLKNITNYQDGTSDSIGVCQLKTDTANFLVDNYHLKRHITSESLSNPKTNAYFAALYLKYQLDRYNQNWYQAVAAYNAGSYLEKKRKPGYAINHWYAMKVMEKLPLEFQPKILYPESILK